MDSHHLLFAGLPAHPIPAVRRVTIEPLESDPFRTFRLTSSGGLHPRPGRPSWAMKRPYPSGSTRSSHDISQACLRIARDNGAGVVSDVPIAFAAINWPQGGRRDDEPMAET